VGSYIYVVSEDARISRDQHIPHSKSLLSPDHRCLLVGGQDDILRLEA